MFKLTKRSRGENSQPAKQFCNKNYRDKKATIRPFALSSKVKIIICISTNYIVEQRSDKCKKHENVKKRGIKNNKNIQE